ncbi:MAG: hypothetical protein V1733_00445 [bacterium]
MGKAEKCFTEAEEAQFQKALTTGAQATPGSSKKESNSGGNATGSKDIQTQLNRIIQVEGRTNITINPDKTAVKFYQARTVKATWKLRGKGTVLIAKDLAKKEKYRLDIQEINNNQMVVVEHLPVGGIKITYEKESNPDGGGSQ